MTRRHLLVGTALVVLLTAGCGVRPSGVITGGPAPTDQARGVTLYFLDGRAQVEIALAKGKKSRDKRAALAERQANRETEQAIGRRLKGMD